MTDFTHDCIIVGGGPAGLSAAIYLQRSHRKTIVIDRGDSRVKMAPRIRNLAGYTHGIPGRVLLGRMRRQARQFGAELVHGDAVIRRRRGGFEVSSGETSYTSRFVILATGLRDIQPPVENVGELCRKGLLAYCPICDGFEQSGKKIGVIISSKAGFGKVRFLSRFSRRLHVILIKDVPLTPKIRKDMKKLDVHVSIGALDFLREGRGGHLIVGLKNQRPFAVDVAYVELGFRVPHDAVRSLRNLRKVKNGRFMMTRHQQTAVKGLYAIGDAANLLAQVSVGTGEAAIAATDIHNQLSKLEGASVPRKASNR